MPRSHGSSVKGDARYEKLRERGYSKEKAARIANTPRRAAAKRGGAASAYPQQTRAQLYEKAKRVGIPGRSQMSKAQLMDALRHH